MQRLAYASMAVALAGIMTSACAKTATMRGHSMEPTLQDGQRLLLLYRPGTAERGDIVELRWPKDPARLFVERVVGLPGEEISSDQGRIAINGRPLDEPYVADANRSRDSWPVVRIPPDSYFVMGDHRNNSSDSRSWGVVPRDLVLAKVVR